MLWWHASLRSKKTRLDCNVSYNNNNNLYWDGRARALAHTALHTSIRRVARTHQSMPHQKRTQQTAFKYSTQAVRHCANGRAYLCTKWFSRFIKYSKGESCVDRKVFSLPVSLARPASLISLLSLFFFIPLTFSLRPTFLLYYCIPFIRMICFTNEFYKQKKNKNR